MSNELIPAHIIEQILRSELGGQADAVMKRIMLAAGLDVLANSATQVGTGEEEPDLLMTTEKPVQHISREEQHVAAEEQREAIVEAHAEDVQAEAARPPMEGAPMDVPIVDTPYKSGKKESTEPKEPKVKKEWVILLSGDKADFPKDMQGWVLQVEEGTKKHEVLRSVSDAFSQFNASKKGQQDPVDTVGELLEAASGKFFKESGVTIKTKQAVWALVTNNRPDVPDEE